MVDLGFLIVIQPALFDLPQLEHALSADPLLPNAWSTSSREAAKKTHL